jgi:hypothetical protein
MPPVALRHSLMPTLLLLLPMGDEFAMNFEAVSFSFSAFMFLEIFASLGANFAEKGAAPSVGSA